MLNVVAIMGRLVADPELRTTQSGTNVCSFRIACDRNFARQGEQRQADFIDIVAWRQQAEFVSKYFTKGRMAVVSGRLQIRNWNDKDGNKRRSAEVVADNVYFGDSKRDSESGGSYASGSSYGGNNYAAGSSYSAPAAPSYAAPASAPASDFAMLEDDDAQLPF